MNGNVICKVIKEEIPVGLCKYYQACIRRPSFSRYSHWINMDLMPRICKYVFLLGLFSPARVVAQQDVQLFLYNAGLGGLTAGVGTLLHKPKGANWRKAFARAFWQGSLGGVLQYSGKKTVCFITKEEEKAYGLPAMLLHAAGSSMIENAAYNRPFLQTWHLNYGPARFDFSCSGDDRFRVRLLPMALYGVMEAAQYGKPDWQLSAWTGCITFVTKEPMGPANKLSEVAGLSFSRAMAYTSYYGPAYQYETIAHELVHYFQFNEYQIFNTWGAPAVSDIRQEWLKKIFTHFIYFDAPYFYLAYGIEGRHPAAHYYRNFFEMEAERFATNKDTD